MNTKTRIFKEFEINGEAKKCLAVSYSQLESFISCPLKWARYYLLGEGEPEDTESTVLGSVIHSQIEEYCKRKQEGNSYTKDEFVEVVTASLEDREIKFNEEDDEVIVEQHIDMAKSICDGDKGLGELLTYTDVVAQELPFKLIFKLPFEVTYNNEIYSEVVINGFIDLVLRDKYTNRLIVVDHKTSKKLFSEDKLYSNYQFPIYSLVILDMFGELPSHCYYYMTRFNELTEAPTLVMNDEDIEVVKYYTRGANKGKPKYMIKSVNLVRQELSDIFKQMYMPSGKGHYKGLKSPLCSWCQFSPWYGSYPVCNQAQFYQRDDIPTRNKEDRKSVIAC